MKRKYTLYTLDKNNRFLKDCFHLYFEEVKSFEDHFSPEELKKIKKLKAKKKSKEKATDKIKKKPHKYHL